MAYAFWDYWGLYQKVTFDGENKTITVNDEVTSLNIRSEIYSAWVRWLVIEHNTSYYPAMRYTGLDIIPGGFTGDTYFLINGWKLLVDLSKVSVAGILFSDDYPSAYFTPAMVQQYPAQVAALVNTVTNTQNIITGDLATIPSAAQNATAVRAEISPELAAIILNLDAKLSKALTKTQFIGLK